MEALTWKLDGNGNGKVHGDRTHKTKHFGTPEIIKTNANGKWTVVCRELHLIPTHIFHIRHNNRSKAEMRQGANDQVTWSSRNVPRPQVLDNAPDNAIGALVPSFVLCDFSTQCTQKQYTKFNL